MILGGILGIMQALTVFKIVNSKVSSQNMFLVKLVFNLSFIFFIIENTYLLIHYVQNQKVGKIKFH